jgi:hypothetical protein
MSSRSVRVLLLLGALGVVASAAFVVFTTERAIGSRQATQAATDAQARAIETALARLTAAQQAYVAQGQSSPYWITQASEQLAAVDRGVAELASLATTEATRSAVQAAAASLEQFRGLDKRARQFVQNDQSLLASDIIFTESLGPLSQAQQHVATAAGNELAAGASELASLRSRQFYAAAGAVGVLLLVVLLLVPVPEADVDVLTAMRALTESAPLRPQATATPAPKPRPEMMAFDDEDSSARVLPKIAAAPPVPAAPVPVLASTPGVDLAQASRICAELARVVDAGGITAFLARAADVLDAPGLIVWVADAPATALYPLFSHGYPSSVLMRLGSLPTDADNATAASWRSGDAVTIDATPEQRGALVTPIITAEGCVGVLAAELQNHGETREEIRALATIFAAQLATIVTPVAAVGEPGLSDRVAK